MLVSTFAFDFAVYPCHFCVLPLPLSLACPRSCSALVLVCALCPLFHPRPGFPFLVFVFTFKFDFAFVCFAFCPSCCRVIHNAYQSYIPSVRNNPAQDLFLGQELLDGWVAETSPANNLIRMVNIEGTKTRTKEKTKTRTKMSQDDED